MGRPIKKRFFGNLNTPRIGGESVATVGTLTGGSSTGTYTVTFSAPTLPTGVTATGTPVKTGNTVTSVTITNAGSGYISAPSVTFAATVGTTGTGVAVLTSTTQNAIAGLAYLKAADGGTAAKLFDIKKQEASKRYLVTTADGSGQCRLVASSVVDAGEMNIIATDTNGSTYFVKKLTARRAVLVQSTASESFVYADGSAQGWTLGSAATGVVSIANN